MPFAKKFKAQIGIFSAQLCAFFGYKIRNFRFFEKKLAKNFLKDFVIVAVLFVQTPLNLAQIARWNSVTPNANVFVRKRTKTALCY